MGAWNFNIAQLRKLPSGRVEISSDLSGCLVVFVRALLRPYPITKIYLCLVAFFRRCLNFDSYVGITLGFFQQSIRTTNAPPSVYYDSLFLYIVGLFYSAINNSPSTVCMHAPPRHHR